MLPNREQLSKLDTNNTQLDFDATSLYPSSMRDDRSVYPKIETEFAFKPHMIHIYVEAFNIQPFNQDGNEKAILKLKYYNPPNPMFQHLPVKEKVKKIEVDRIRNGYFTDTLTSVDICEIVKLGAKVIEINEGIIHQKNFKLSPLRTFIENMFAVRQKYEDENTDLMQNLAKLVMNSLNGVQIRKDINDSFYCKSEQWMKTEYDDNVLDY